MASNVLFDCETLALLRFRHLGHHFLKTGDFTSISFILQQGTALCSQCGATER